MTQVERPRVNVRRAAVVYGIDVLDHHTGLIVPNDYIGQTRQKGRARENQHRDSQPFSDRIVGSPRVLWEGLCTDDELDAIERRFIRELRPRLNWVHNEDNPGQIPKWIQLEQRLERDDAEGRLRWVPLDQRPAVSLVEQPMRVFPAGVSRAPARQPWPGWKQKATLWAGSWLLLAATIVAAGHAYGIVVAWPPVLIIATITQVAVIVWSLAGAPISRRQWRRARRRLPGWMR